jgi:hypothetical protein
LPGKLPATNATSYTPCKSNMTRDFAEEKSRKKKWKRKNEELKYEYKDRNSAHLIGEFGRMNYN